MKAISFLSYQQDASAWAAKYAGCKVRGPGYAKYADPRKVRGPMQSTRAAFWVRGALSAQIRAKCVGRGSIAWAALSAWAAIARSGEWAALSTHLPRTCRAMPTQCNRGSTHVGRNEPQSSGTLRVKVRNYLAPNFTTEDFRVQDRTPPDNYVYGCHITLVTRRALGYVSYQQGIIQGHLVYRYASRRAPVPCSRIVF